MSAVFGQTIHALREGPDGRPTNDVDPRVAVVMDGKVVANGMDQGDEAVLGRSRDLAALPGTPVGPNGDRYVVDKGCFQLDGCQEPVHGRSPISRDDHRRACRISWLNHTIACCTRPPCSGSRHKLRDSAREGFTSHHSGAASGSSLRPTDRVAGGSAGRDGRATEGARRRGRLPRAYSPRMVCTSCWRVGCEFTNAPRTIRRST